MSGLFPPRKSPFWPGFRRLRKRPLDPTNDGQATLVAPGGKAHSAEALKQALRRELKEEIGLTVVSAKVIDLFDRPQRSGLAVLFQTKLRKGELKLRAKEIKNAAFVDKLPSKATPSVSYFWKRQFPSLSGRGNILDL